MKAKTPYQRQVQADFETWCQARKAASLGGTRPVVPAPHEPGGLPDGWELVAPAPQPWRVWDTDFVDVVVRPSAGGWAVVTIPHPSLGDHFSYKLPLCEPTLGELYARVCSLADSPEPVLQKGWMPVEETLRHYITAAYDSNDPAEAAEQMLVALGVRPVRMPTALI